MKNVRPPAVCLRGKLRGDGAPLRGAFQHQWRREDNRQVIQPSASARTAMLDEENEAKRALGRLAETRAECGVQHKKNAK